VIYGREDDIVDPATQSEKFLIALKQAGFFARKIVVPGPAISGVRSRSKRPAASAPMSARGCCGFSLQPWSRVNRKWVS
jgi:hypothetical protein